MNEVTFPKTIDFGICPIGQRSSNSFPISPLPYNSSPSLSASPSLLQLPCRFQWVSALRACVKCSSHRGVHALVCRRTKAVTLECKVPMSFEYRLTPLDTSPDITVEPLEGPARCPAPLPPCSPFTASTILLLLPSFSLPFTPTSFYPAPPFCSHQPLRVLGNTLSYCAQPNNHIKRREILGTPRRGG